MPQLILSVHSGVCLTTVQLERLTRYECDGREHPDLAIDEVLSTGSKARKDVAFAGFSRTEFLEEILGIAGWNRRE
jgi:hypothetical protein